jgi:DNA repair exonuclease SbcCD ATPase subunit
MPKGSRYDRILRVRTLQLGQVRAEEGRARAKVEHEQALRERIAQLSANVAPTEAQSTATSMMAAAHYRERLHQSAYVAQQRVAVAEQSLTAAAEATREAKRDQSAIEKLIARGEAEAAIKALRALEALPPTGKNRHDLC